MASGSTTLSTVSHRAFVLCPSCRGFSLPLSPLSVSCTRMFPFTSLWCTCVLTQTDKMLRRVWERPACRIAALPSSDVLLVGVLSFLHALHVPPLPAERKRSRKPSWEEELPADSSSSTAAASLSAAAPASAESATEIVTLALTGGLDGHRNPCFPELRVSRSAGLVRARFTHGGGVFSQDGHADQAVFGSVGAMSICHATGTIWCVGRRLLDSS